VALDVDCRLPVAYYVYVMWTMGRMNVFFCAHDQEIWPVPKGNHEVADNSQWITNRVH